MNHTEDVQQLSLVFMDPNQNNRKKKKVSGVEQLVAGENLPFHLDVKERV
jgi:hypothetical protein